MDTTGLPYAVVPSYLAYLGTVPLQVPGLKQWIERVCVQRIHLRF